MVCSGMIKLYTPVIPDYGDIFFYIAEFCFSSKTHSTYYLHEATLREKNKKKAISVSNRRSSSCMHYFRSSKNVKLVDKREKIISVNNCMQQQWL